MNPGALFCLLLAHFIADFPLQSNYILKLREDGDLKKSLQGACLHAGVHFVTSILSVIYFWSWKMVLVVAVISLAHIVIDFLKSRLINKYPSKRYNISIFLLDQILHLLVICSALYGINRASAVSPLFRTEHGETRIFISGSLAGATYNQKLVLALMLVVIGLWGTGVFIRIVLAKMSLLSRKGKDGTDPEPESDTPPKGEGAIDGGFIIGILERFFIIISIVFNMQIVIGFILTVKSVARLKKFDDEAFVEIFIIGSFISFISAIIIGYAVKLLGVIPY